MLINPALVEGQIDANFFQHIPYLDDFNSQNQADLKWIAKIHNEPQVVYSNTITDIDSVSDGATVGIPNDATNGGRALMVLERAGDRVKGRCQVSWQPNRISSKIPRI